MKRIFLIIITILITVTVVGCSGEEDNTSNSDNEKNDGQGKTEKKEIYQIGETAETESDVFGVPYSITVNSFELSKDKMAEGVTMEDIGYTDEDVDARFAIVNVTIKNIGEESFVPNDTISAQLESDTMASESDFVDETFKERDKELGPGEEITGNLVYANKKFIENETIYFVYENESINNEVKFELPIEE